MYKQLVTPNPDVPCRPGWCLEYVQRAFKTAHLYPNARVAWEQAKLKHTDVPKGIWVPIYFDDLRITEDHIAILAPDGSVYSSSHPTSTKAVKHKSISDTIAYYGYNLVYRGWSEDMAGTTIVKKENIMNENDIKSHYLCISGVPATKGNINAWKGADYKACTEEMKRYFTERNQAYNQYKAQAEKKIADLEKKIKDLEKQGTFVKVSDLYIKK